MARNLGVPDVVCEYDGFEEVVVVEDEGGGLRVAEAVSMLFAVR